MYVGALSFNHRAVHGGKVQGVIKEDIIDKSIDPALVKT